MSCLFGKSTQKQCTPLRADDCSSKSKCGVWDDDCPKCGGMMSDGKVGKYCPYCGVDKPKRNTEARVVPAESFVRTLAANVTNKKLSDKDFRRMVRRTLPIVIYKA